MIYKIFIASIFVLFYNITYASENPLVDLIGLLGSKILSIVFIIGGGGVSFLAIVAIIYYVIKNKK